MGRGKTGVPDIVRWAHAWAYMRRDPDYRAAWAGNAGLPRFEAGAFPLRVQTGADLAAAADWGLLAWDDPRVGVWRSPFWSGIPMLVGEPNPDPWPDTTPLLPLLAGAGATVEGLRLMNGRFPRERARQQCPQPQHPADGDPLVLQVRLPDRTTAPAPLPRGTRNARKALREAHG